MKFTTDTETEYEYYYSATADRDHGHNMVDGVKYCEMIRAGRFIKYSQLRKKYSDLKLVHINKPFKNLWKRKQKLSQ